MKIYFQNVLADAYVEIYGDPFQRPDSGAPDIKTPPLKSRVTNIRKTLLKHAPDILLLNETTRELHQYLLPKYHEVAFLEDEISQDLPPEKKPGMSILVNEYSKLVCERWSRLDGSHSIHAKISGINFIVHHNDPSMFGGDEQIACLMKSIAENINEDEPVILAGDFNACPHLKSELVRRISKRFSDPWRWSMDHSTYFPCYPKSSGKRYDYIFTRGVKFERLDNEPLCLKDSNGWRGMADNIKMYGSDHIPLVLNVNI